MIALKIACLLAGLAQHGLPVSIAQDEPDRPPALQQIGAADLILDLHRFELVPQAGFTYFSEDFEGGPSPCLGLIARAPLPFLAPREDELHEAIGAFVQVTWSTIDRDIPASGSTDGSLFFIGVGVDFLLLRQKDAFVRGQLGFEYGALSDVEQLDSGFALLTGVLSGVQLFQGVWLTWDIEFAIGNSGDWILFNQAGAVIRF